MFKVNGFPVLAFKAGESNDQGVVLVERGVKEYDRYVTWNVSQGEDKIVAFWGHYFSDYDEAWADFLARS